MTTLFDEAARAAIETDLDRNLFVEAGAGTGKTAALVARVVALVRRGTPLAEVVAITFTEAAAAELRERVREALGAAAAGGGPGADRCREALDRFDDATISTLHAFAQRVLAEFPVEAGLPPGFEVLDDIQATIDFAERWSQFLDQLFADPDRHRALTVAGALGLRTSRLEELARLVHDDWDRLAAQRLPAIEPVPTLDPAAALRALDAAVEHASECREPADRLLAHLGVVAGFRDRLRAAGPDEGAALDVLAERPAVSSSAGQKPNWPDKTRVVDALREADAAVEALVASVVEPTVVQLLHSVCGFVRAAVDERRRRGRLEFHDLLVLARDLVRDDAAVRAALHDRYRHLLLDEFQDTDPLQIELAVLVATDAPDAGARPWWTCPVPPGRLFVVGDPKQSIYRFRRADIELYHRVRDHFGERLTLTTNFRSRPAVIEFVNAVFATLLGPGAPGPPDEAAEPVPANAGRTLQAAYDPLTPIREPGSPVVTVVGGEHPREVDLAAIRRHEAQELAALLHRVRDEGWPVARRGDDGRERVEPARFADVAVLLPTRATLPYLEQALDDAGIPARIESQSLVYATTEVQDLLAILTAIDDPADQVAVVAALRSPGFACRDDRLAEFRLAGGRWDYRAPPPPSLAPEHPVVAAMDALGRLHERRWWDTVSETVERVIRERHLMELAVGRRRPRDHWRRLRFVADAARAFVDGGGTSLRGFVTWLSRQVDEEARVVELVVPEPDDDAVRILTVHGAKGLEFPITVLAGLGVADRTAVSPVLWDADGRLQVLIGPRGRGAGFRYVSAGYEARAAHEQVAATAEQIRLCYVAATRARDHLVVSLHHRAGTQCHASRLLGAVAASPERWVTVAPLERSTGEAVGRAGDDGTGPGEVEADDGDAWVEARTRVIAAGRRRPVVAATALARAAAPLPAPAPRPADEAAEADEAGDDKPEADAAGPGYRRGRGGTAVGRAVHAVLQTVDLATGAGLDATARAQALAEGVPEREGEIRALAAAALRAPVVREAVEGGWAWWREVPVGAVVDGVLVEGFVDLLLEAPDGLVVVDYKTDQVPRDADLDAAVARYEVQGGAYALALEAVLGRPVHRCVFVFARAPSPVQRDVPDLAAAMARARAALPAAIATAG